MSNSFLLLLFTALCLAIMLARWSKPTWMYEFPFLAAATFLAFILPQAIGLQDSFSVSQDAFQRGMWMSILCAAGCYAGYFLCAQEISTQPSAFDDHRILLSAAILTGVGAVFFFWISRLPEELTAASQWTGLPVALLFFAKALSCGFALAALHWAKTRSPAALLISAIGLCFYLDRIFLAGRRHVAAELVLICALAAWFGRRRAPPRWTCLPVLLLATLLIYSTGDFRASRVSEGRNLVETLRVMPLTENFKRVLSEGGPEFRNALVWMDAVSASGDFDFGLFHWNKLVTDFVPAQWVGSDFKRSLLNSKVAETTEELRAGTPMGSTVTGITDAFGSFGYAGCIKFIFIAAIMGWFYRRAEAGFLPCQLAYMLFIVPSLHAVTHSTQFFFSSALHLALLLCPFLFWSVADEVTSRRAIVGDEVTSRRRSPPTPAIPPTAPPNLSRTR